MKSTTFLFMAIALCLGWGSTSSANAQARDTLDQAVRRLEQTTKDKTGFSQQLQTALANFLAAATTPEDKSTLDRRTKTLDAAMLAEQKRAGYSHGAKSVAIENALSAANQFLNSGGNDPTPTPSVSTSPTPSPGEQDKNSGLMGLLIPIGGGIAAAALIVLLIFGILRMRRGYWARFDHHVGRAVKANTAELMQRQDELAKHFVALGNQHRSGSARLESIEGELQALGRRARAMSDGRGYQSDSSRNSGNDSSRPQAPPVEPEFPASVNEYLNKMKRNSTVVKPDFQNGILVSDLDGRGELVLIRDTRLADGAQPLFLVPRVGQFQTKQEFHSYYERYYECQRPSAGDVWIIDPAVVSTVPGGWELREKGVLEVR